MGVLNIKLAIWVFAGRRYMYMWSKCTTPKYSLCLPWDEPCPPAWREAWDPLGSRPASRLISLSFSFRSSSVASLHVDGPCNFGGAVVLSVLHVFKQFDILRAVHNHYAVRLRFNGCMHTQQKSIILSTNIVFFKLLSSYRSSLVFPTTLVTLRNSAASFHHQSLCRQGLIMPRI